jgi:hypothetical protein
VNTLRMIGAEQVRALTTRLSLELVRECLESISVLLVDEREA